ncbi:SDR family NAD(P)-dependent oxidoreductase [Actinomadura sp. 7K507]|uniref:SDR family NAD(P)-dependent oxidoreductase n=1 Tax=Actinomadura sp. 7K507 TaxID=2530365 RepID=UPI00140540CF|nr:SDR family NAD(P)-dependent oxidoreductase [Actinomadura sp. 7K507]
MRTIVITGGTDGMGAALARHFLAAGDRVVVLGRSRAKFDTLLAGVARESPSAPSRAEFIATDLSLVQDSRRAIDQLRREHGRVDALILAASFIRQRRHVTSEGHEASWSLFFLSKYLFVTGLADLLRTADRPIVVNTAVPGARADAIDFDDLEMVGGFTFTRSNAQQRRANELLGILATGQNPALGYITWGPARLVRTGFAGEVGIGMKLAAALLAPLLGQRAEKAVRPIIDLVDAPTPGRAAYRGAKPRPLTASVQDGQDAARLATAVTASL